MRCKYTNAPMAAVWTHPDLAGQWVAAFTRKDAFHLCNAITGKSLDVSKFSRTGMFVHSPRIFSTMFDLNQKVAQQKEMVDDSTSAGKSE